MLEETNTIEDQETVISAESETTENQVEPQAELSEVDALIQRRMGNFEINISPADLKYVKNLLNNKVEWKGPNEAYLILMALLSLSSELKEVDI